MINFYFFTIGTCFASFLGLVVDRFPNQSILTPRSHCDHCQHVLGVWDLIPIISQLLHRFRCRYCHQTYPFWYCLFEIWSGLIFLACANGFLSLPQLLTLLGSAVLAIYDLRFMEYPLAIWCCLHALVLFLSASNLLMLVFLLLAIGAHFFFIGMGAGDFLLLATFLTQLFFYQDPHSHPDRIHLRHSLLCPQKRKRPDSLCSLSLSQLSRFTALYDVF